jgi:hypothetical protein
MGSIKFLKAAYLEKIKSLQFPSSKAVVCDLCGKPMTGQKLVGFAVRIEGRRVPREEASFSA